jgi:enoyl-CoA hydratase/carnithine racemase
LAEVAQAARNVDVTIEDGLATIVLNHPARRNAMSIDMWDQLGQTVARLDRDPAARVMIIRGAGTQAFSAGADISEFDEHRSTPEKALAYNRRVSAAVAPLHHARKPLIAMIYGFCVGGGAEIALSCDLRVASADAVFGIPAARLGISYEYADFKRLCDIVGPANAKYVFFTGDPRIPAPRACEMGLVNEVVPTDQLESRVRELAFMIADNSPASLFWAKQAIELVLRDPGLATVPNGAEEAAKLFGGPDYREGVAAFMEKRKPRFDWEHA